MIMPGMGMGMAGMGGGMGNKIEIFLDIFSGKFDHSALNPV